MLIDRLKELNKLQRDLLKVIHIYIHHVKIEKNGRQREKCERSKRETMCTYISSSTEILGNSERPIFKVLKKKDYKSRILYLAKLYYKL